MPTRPRILFVAIDEQVSCRLRRALEADYDVSRLSSLDAPLDVPLQEADVALLDWSILNQLILEATLKNATPDTREEWPITGDLKAVAQLGAILKRLSANSQTRRRRIKKWPM